MEEAKTKMQETINNLKKDIEDMEGNLKKVNAKLLYLKERILTRNCLMIICLIMFKAAWDIDKKLCFKWTILFTKNDMIYCLNFHFLDIQFLVHPIWLPIGKTISSNIEVKSLVIVDYLETWMQYLTFRLNKRRQPRTTRSRL